MEQVKIDGAITLNSFDIENLNIETILFKTQTLQLKILETLFLNLHIQMKKLKRIFNFIFSAGIKKQSQGLPLHIAAYFYSYKALICSGLSFTLPFKALSINFKVLSLSSGSLALIGR